MSTKWTKKHTIITSILLATIGGGTVTQTDTFKNLQWSISVNVSSKDDTKQSTRKIKKTHNRVSPYRSQLQQDTLSYRHIYTPPYKRLP